MTMAGLNPLEALIERGDEKTIYWLNPRRFPIIPLEIQRHLLCFNNSNSPRLQHYLNPTPKVGTEEDLTLVRNTVVIPPPPSPELLQIKGGISSSDGASLSEGEGVRAEKPTPRTILGRFRQIMPRLHPPRPLPPQHRHPTLPHLLGVIIPVIASKDVDDDAQPSPTRMHTRSALWTKYCAL